MKAYFKNHSTIKFFFDVCLLIVIYSVIACCLLNVTIRNAVLWGLVQLLVIILGFAILRFLYTPQKKWDFILVLSHSYVFGYALSILLFLFCAILNSYFLCGVGKIVFCFLAITITTSVLFLLKTTAFSIEQRVKCRDICLLSIYFILVLFAYCAFYFIPKDIQNISYHADALYWIENASALMRNFKPFDPRMAGVLLDYHYFASAFLAFESTVSGIDLFTLGYPLYGFSKVIIFFGSIYSLLSECLCEQKENDKCFLRTLGIVLLLFCTGYERISIVTYTSHTLLLPFGCDIAIAIGAMVISLTHEAIIKHFTVRHCIMTVILFFVFAGHKAPMALIFLVFSFVICCCWLYERRIYNSVCYGFGEVIAFLLIMVVCVNFFSGNDSRVNAGSMSLFASNNPVFRLFDIHTTADILSLHGFILYLIGSCKSGVDEEIR